MPVRCKCFHLIIQQFNSILIRVLFSKQPLSDFAHSSPAIMSDDHIASIMEPYPSAFRISPYVIPSSPGLAIRITDTPAFCAAWIFSGNPPVAPPSFVTI